MAQEYDTYGDSYYSTYQNNDKKYECQKGPFKGFFVTSAEFCDAKSFDDKKMKKDRPIVEDPEPPEPQEPPTPTPQTSSLTINKEIFGCFSNSIFIMFCENLQDGDLRWLPCIGSSISTTDFCEQLTANLFDIEVLDDQNIPVVEPFIGRQMEKLLRI